MGEEEGERGVVYREELRKEEEVGGKEKREREDAKNRE